MSDLSEQNLAVLIAAHGRWVKGGEGVRLDLSDLNLEQCDLSEQHLVHSVFVATTLLGADLSNANLAHADLEGANLENADLSGANLESANLLNASMGHCDLKGANLDNANLTGVDLTHVSLADCRHEPDLID